MEIFFCSQTIKVLDLSYYNNDGNFIITGIYRYGSVVNARKKDIQLYNMEEVISFDVKFLFS